jgi:acetolactate synthase-1/2/3 large subunit
MTLRSPRAGVHALGGGIGQGLPMAIGAALAAPDRKTVALTGDGGLTLCLGELATLAQERANVLLIVMNDGGYGVIRNIQDAQFGGRHYLANLQTPEFGLIARALGLAATRVGDAPSFASALERLGATPGPAILEVDMAAFGSFAKAFAGPPVREAARA